MKRLQVKQIVVIFFVYFDDLHNNLSLWLAHRQLLFDVVSIGKQSLCVSLNLLESVTNYET